MTEAQRKAVYGVVAALLSCAAAFGLLSANDAGQITEAITSVIGALASILAYMNTGTGGRHAAED